jgi:hypothetical protein
MFCCCEEVSHRSARVTQIKGAAVVPTIAFGGASILFAPFAPLCALREIDRARLASRKGANQVAGRKGEIWNTQKSDQLNLC